MKLPFGFNLDLDLDMDFVLGINNFSNPSEFTRVVFPNCLPNFQNLNTRSKSNYDKNIANLVSKSPKGQIISECPFEILDFPKIPPKIWQISALESEKWSNHKIKALYNVFNTLNNKFDHIYYEKVPLSYDLTTF